MGAAEGRAPRAGHPVLAFFVTQLVTENSRLPAVMRSVKLPFGNPIAIAVCLWIGADLVRRFSAALPLDAETGEPRFGDGFEAGPVRRTPGHPNHPAEAPQPRGSLGPIALAHRR